MPAVFVQSIYSIMILRIPILSALALLTFALFSPLVRGDDMAVAGQLQSLGELKKLPKLAKLSFYETDLAAGDVDKLREELKAVAIGWKPLTDEQRRKFEMYLPK